MAKRILSACFILVIGFLGLNFLTPSLSLVKTAEATSHTIADFRQREAGGSSDLLHSLNVSGSRNFIDESNNILSAFELGTTPLLVGQKIIVEFPSGFTLQSGTTNAYVTTTNAHKFECDVQPRSRTATCTNVNTLPIDPESAIAIMVEDIKNPPTENTYTIRVSSDNAGLGADSDTIFIEDATPPPALEGCTWNWRNPMKSVWECIASIPLMIATTMANLIIDIVKIILGAIVGVLILLAAQLVQLAASLPFEGETAASLGHEIALGLTNIGFVIAIIVIAFATMLRQENYAIQKALPRLIIIAILINFGWFFAIFLINISNSLADGLTAVVSSVAKSSFGLDKIHELGNYFTGQLDKTKMDSILPDSLFFLPGLEFLLQILKGLVEALMQAIFGLVGVFALLATAIMLILRYIVLSFLLILLPFAMLAYIFPGTSGQFKKWTSEFIKWIVFYPAVMFFLAIGFATSKSIENLKIINEDGMTAAEITAATALVPIMNILVVSGIMIGGLIVAQKLGVAGANYFTNAGKVLAKGGSAWAVRKGFLGPAAGLIGRRLLRGAGGASDQEKSNEPPSTRPRLNLAGQPEGVPIPGEYGSVRKDARGNWIRGDGSSTDQPSNIPIPDRNDNIDDNMSAENQQWRIVEEPPTPSSDKWSRKNLKKTLEEIPPSKRERAGAWLNKFSMGGKSLWNITEEAFKLKKPSMAGYEKLEKQMGEAEGMLEGLEARMKEPEKLRDKSEKLLSKQMKLESDLEKAESKLKELRNTGASEIKIKEQEDRIVAIDKHSSRIGKQIDEIGEKGTGGKLDKAIKDAKDAERQYGDKDKIKTTQEQIKTAKKDFSPELKYKPEKNKSGGDKK